MNYNNVEEIFQDLDKIRGALKQKVSTLTPEQANTREGENGWTVAEIVEHIGIVESGVIQITNKLLTQAEGEGLKSDGSFSAPISLVEQLDSIKDKKLQAPERIHPRGMQNLAESLAKLDENRQALAGIRSRVEAVDSSNTKFPHPFFGDLNLYQWLVMIGGHEFRHLKQIERILA